MRKLFPVFFLLCISMGIQGQNALKEIKHYPSNSGPEPDNDLGYPVAQFTPKTNFSDTILFSGLKNIKLVDGRPDNSKVGFTPVEYGLTNRGYDVLGLQIDRSPVKWLQENFNRKNIITDAASNRQLVLVLQKFWFSNSASERYTAAKPRLLTTLYYHFDMYTSLNDGYYPQVTFSGTLSAMYNKGNAYNELADSLLLLLKEKIQATAGHYTAKETHANWISPADFTEYYKQRIKKPLTPEKIPKGIYATYEDFLAKKPLSDSVEMLVAYNNDERSETYACQLTVYKEGRPSSCYKNWGYFDGFSLFVNTGNGFYIKLTRAKDDFVFFYLKNIDKEKIQPYLLSSMQIGNSSFDILQKYSKVFSLTYQLDYDTGKLY